MNVFLKSLYYDLDLTLMNANSNLNGNGVSPTELLKVRRESDNRFLRNAPISIVACQPRKQS